MRRGDLTRLSPRCCPPGLPLGLNKDRIPGLEEAPAAAAAAAAAGTAAAATAVAAATAAAAGAPAEPQAISSAVSELTCWIKPQQQHHQQQQQLIAGVVSFGLQRKRMLTDGLGCIRHLTIPQAVANVAGAALFVLAAAAVSWLLLLLPPSLLLLQRQQQQQRCD
ncbi:hypothetical protein ACSSS7_003190 [Eimeria intestinalis]